MEDYRVKTGWRNHPKRKKLRRLLGAEAVLALYDLWEFCAETKTDGDLSGMSNEDIALAADYDEDPAEWIQALLDLRLLDGEPGALRIHDWPEHNPWVAGHRQRSEKARAAAQSRWDPPKEKGDKEPEPEPEPANDAEKAKRKQLAADVRAVFAYYRKYHPRAHVKPSSKSKEWRHIVNRFKEGSTVQDLCDAIDGCHRSAFHMGKNDLGKKYNSLELITRDASKVQQFMEVPEQGELPTLNSPFLEATNRAAQLAAKEDGNDQTRVRGADDQAPRLLPDNDE